MTPLISGLASVASLLFNASSGRSAAAAQPAAEAASAGPASVLKLSAEAQSLAGVAGQAASGAAALATSTGAAASGKSVSTEDFRTMLTRFGATDAQKEQLTAGLDANKDGSISQDEFLKGLANTQGTQAGSAISQTLMQVMDQAGNHDGTVGRKEFLTLTTAFATTAQGSKKV